MVITKHFKRSLITLASVASLLTPAAIPAVTHAAGQPDNWGQCIELLRSLGVNPSELAPGANGQFGPAVIIYDANGNIVGIHQAQGFDGGIACNYVAPSNVTNAYIDANGNAAVELAS